MSLRQPSLFVRSLDLPAVRFLAARVLQCEDQPFLSTPSSSAATDRRLREAHAIIEARGAEIAAHAEPVLS